MKTKAAAVSEDEDEPRKVRSSRSKRRHTRRASTESESPPRKRFKKPSKRTADKKSKRSKGSSSSSRRRRRSPSRTQSLSSSSSPSSVSRSCSTCSSSSSERSLSPPPRSRSRDVKRRKGRGRDRERDPKRRKARRSTSLSSTSSSGSSRSRSRSRSKSSKRWTKDGTTRDKIGKDCVNDTDSFGRDEEALVAAKKVRYETERCEKNVSLEKIENPPSKNANETEDALPAADGGSPVAEDLELILRQKALENFRKFRAAAAMAGKTDNGATLNETLADSPQNAGTRVTEARSAAISPFHRQASSLGVRHPTESPKSEDCGNGTSPWMQRSSAGVSHGAGSPHRVLKDGDIGGSIPEATHSTFQPRSRQDGSNRRSVMQRLANTPGSSSSVNRRLGPLGSNAGVSCVNGAPRIKSVVSIPAREGLHGSTSPQRPSENSVPAESGGEVRCTTINISREAEGTNGDGANEPSASNGSVLSSDDGKRQVTEPRIEDNDSVSQLQKKTFSRMHDGETVEVSYKVYIPKKTPALARRKLQR